MEEANLCTKVSYHQSQAWGRSAKGPEPPKTHHCQPAPNLDQPLEDPQQYTSYMKQVLRESAGKGKRCLPGYYKFKLGSSAGSETTQQMSQVN